MSYDIILFNLQEGKDPLEMARSEEIGALPTTPPDPTKEARKQKIVSALRTANSLFEPFDFGYESIAESEQITVEEAKLKYRHIELNEPSDEKGIQVQLYDDEALVTVPYWHDGAMAEAMFKEIWDYLNIIQRETGYVAYDPQLDCILNLSEGYAQALSAYENVRKEMAKRMANSNSQVKPQTKRKWWQFWQ